MIENLIDKWKSIIEKIKQNGGSVHELTMEPPATMQEVNDKETALGIRLPSEFQEVLNRHAKGLYFRWSLPDEAILPSEFREIFAGELGWHTDWLEFWNERDSEDNTCLGLKNKLTFFQVGNGDYIAFDMSTDEEPPVVYWDHETDEVHPIAASFKKYLSKMTELYCIGAEIWQYEAFLGPKGVDTDSDLAERWKHWFDGFQSLRFEEAERYIDTLLPYIKYYGIVKEREVKALQNHDVNKVFHTVLKQLPIVDPKERSALCLVIGEYIRSGAEEWVRGLWVDRAGDVKAEERSYLTARCLPLEEGLGLVMKFLGSSSEPVDPIDALRHLSVFQSNRVIAWLEEYGRLPATNGWAQLYAFSSPKWEDVIRWSKLETRHRLTLIHALEELIRDHKKPYEYRPLKIDGVPSKDDLIKFLEQLHDEEMLNTKKAIIKKVMESVDKIM